MMGDTTTDSYIFLNDTDFDATLHSKNTEWWEDR